MDSKFSLMPCDSIIGNMGWENFTPKGHTCILFGHAVARSGGYQERIVGYDCLHDRKIPNKYELADKLLALLHEHVL